MGIRFVLNKKTIWDNTEFEHILSSNLLRQRDSYLPVKQINNEVVSATVVDDAIRFVSEKAAGSGANAEPKTDSLVVTKYEKQQEQEEDIRLERQQQQKLDNNTTTTTTTTNQVF